MKLEELQVYTMSMEISEKIWNIVIEFETKTWLTKSYNRKFISKPEYEKFNHDIDNIGIKLNNYIKSIGKMTMNDA